MDRLSGRHMNHPFAQGYLKYRRIFHYFFFLTLFFNTLNYRSHKPSHTEQAIYFWAENSFLIHTFLLCCNLSILLLELCRMSIEKVYICLFSYFFFWRPVFSSTFLSDLDQTTSMPPISPLGSYFLYNCSFSLLFSYPISSNIKSVNLYSAYDSLVPYSSLKYYSPPPVFHYCLFLE